MTTLNLTEEQTRTLMFLLHSYSMAKVKPEAVAKLRHEISKLILVVQVATGELPEHEARQVEAWLGN